MHPLFDTLARPLTRRIIPVLALVLALWCIYISISSPVQAVTIDQPILEINANPGETIEHVVRIYDDAKTGLTVYPWVYNFKESPDREGSILLITDPTEQTPAREWIQFDVNRLTLPEDGSLTEFTYRIVLPDDAEPGTHLVAVVFRSQPPPERIEEETAKVYVGANVAASIFLKVSGDIVDQIEADFQAGIYTTKDAKLSPGELKQYFKPKTFFIRPPIDFLLTVDNQGNTHQKPDGNVKIVNDLLGSSEPEKLLVNPENKIILPDENRTFAVPSFGNGFMFGKYRAKLTLLYGNPLRSLEKEVIFWIVPVIELLIALGALLLLIILVILIWYVLNKKRERDEAERQRNMRQEMIELLKSHGIAPASPPEQSAPPTSKKK